MARLDRVNARVAARRPGLLDAAALRELLARPGLDARLAALRSAPVGTRLPPPAPLDEEAALEAAEEGLRSALAEEAAWLLREAEGARPRALLRAFLELDEALAVKAVVRGVAHGAPAVAILAAAPTLGAVPPEAAAAAAEAPDVAAALAILAAGGSALALVAASALPIDPEAGLVPLELAVDRAALARARAACRGPGEDRRVLARHLEDRVDARNAATLLLLGGAPVATPPWIEGGRRLAPAALSALAAGPQPAARAAVAEVFPELAAAAAEPWAMERALEAAVLAPLRREARRSPLSLAVPLRYLLERREEVRRIALVLRGAALGLPLETILGLAEA
jgi:V/A-type H+/Na+-transporting ATPase subunit C